MLACISPFISIAVFIGAVCTVLVVAACFASWRESRK